MSKGKVLITFDDGIANHSWAALELSGRGLQGVFGVVAGKIDAPGFCTERQLGQMQADGHVIINHSWSHGKFVGGDPRGYLKDFSEEEIIEDYEKGRDWLNKLGFSGDFYMVPFGTANLNENTFNKINETARWIRLTIGCLIDGEWSPQGNKRIFPVDYNDSCIGITCAADCRFPNEVKQKIEEACKVGGLCVLCYHDVCSVVGEDQKITWERFGSDIKYIAKKIKDGELECVLPDDIIRSKNE